METKAKDVKASAAYIGMGRTKLFSKLTGSKPEIPSYMDGNKRMILVSDLDKYLAGKSGGRQ